MQIWFINHWPLILQVIGILFVLLIIYLNFFSQKTPPWLADLVNYLNFRDERDIKHWLIYSKFFKKHQVKWLEGYSGKREGKEIFFGIFEEKNQLFFCSIVKAEVSPMILTNQLEDQYDWENIDSLLINKNKYNLFAKEKYLLTNINKSGNFQLMLGELFKGKINLVEFTAINQVIIVSDHLFESSKEGVEFFSSFIHLKDEL